MFNRTRIPGEAAVLLAAFGVIVLPALTQETARPAAKEPAVEKRAAVRYVAIRTSTAMDKLPEVLPKLWQEVFGWLKAQHIEPAGPPMIRYDVIDMPKRLVLDVGVPVKEAVKGNGRIRSGVLPAGRYVVLTHVGAYDGMVQANADLQAWAKKQGVRWQMRETKRGSVWAGRAEFYLRDPGNEKDPQKYETEIVYLAADREIQTPHGR